MTTRIKFL